MYNEVVNKNKEHKDEDVKIETKDGETKILDFVPKCIMRAQRNESALTLDRDAIGDNKGWIVKGEIKEDYYEWVNWFEAYHPVLEKWQEISKMPSMLLLGMRYNNSS